MRLSTGRCRDVLHTPLSSISSRKSKDSRSKQTKTQGRFTLLPSISLFYLSAWSYASNLYVNIRKPQANECFRRRDAKASGESLFLAGNVVLPKAFWCLQLEMPFCLRLFDVSNWKRHFAWGIFVSPKWFELLPEAFGCQQWKRPFAWGFELFIFRKKI